MDWKKIDLSDILPGHGRHKLDDDIVEVYGPAEMLGAIGGSDTEEPTDPDQDLGEIEIEIEEDDEQVEQTRTDEIVVEHPTVLYGPGPSFFSPAPPVPPAYGPAQPYEPVGAPVPVDPDDVGNE